MLDTILADTSATSYELWLTGSNNFRYKVYPEYKANRIGAYRPKWEKAVKEHLTSKWNANWSDGNEADDMCGIRSSQVMQPNIICHLDKDINMIPGKHYNWMLQRLGKVIREARIYHVTLEEADRFFWKQLLTGDTTDNLKGVPGVGPVKADGILRECTTNQECYERIRELFSCDEELDMNAQCLWIQRSPNDSWRSLIDREA
jgi:DNA polymerase-1